MKDKDKIQQIVIFKLHNNLIASFPVYKKQQKSFGPISTFSYSEKSLMRHLLDTFAPDDKNMDPPLITKENLPGKKNLFILWKLVDNKWIFKHFT